MRFGHIEFRTKDPAETKAFYVEGLGFQLTEEQPGGFIWLRLGEIEVLLRPGERPVESSTAYSEGMVLYVDELETALKSLHDRGIVPVGMDGPGCPLFRDPDGRWIQIVENEG